MAIKEDITSTIQPAGIVVLWGSIGLFLFGCLSFSGPPLLLGLIGGTLLLICRSVSRAQLRNLSLSRHLPRRTFLGEPFQIHTQIQNRKSTRSTGGLFVRDGLASRAKEPYAVPLIHRKSELQVETSCRLFRRGWNPGNSYELSSLWPLGLFSTSTVGTYTSPDPDSDGILVLPRPLVPGFLTLILDRLESEAALYSANQPDQFSEFRSLREYRSGDPVKSIHWPPSTRAGRIIVRETDPPKPRPRRYGILIHRLSPPGELVQPERFELILRIAAGLLTRFQRREIPVTFLAGFGGGKVHRIPDETGTLAGLDLLARAGNRGADDLKPLLDQSTAFDQCDQIFVLGPAQRDLWQDQVRAVFPSCICVDPESTSSVRQPRKIRIAGGLAV